MPRACTICAHAQRDAIDGALLNRGPYRGIARTYAVSEDALLRHKSRHLPIAMASTSQTDVAHADDLVTQVLTLQGRVEGILASAEQAGKPVVALQAVRELRELLKLQGTLLGQLGKRPSPVHIDQLVIAQEFREVHAVIIGALAPYPEAREAVLRALEGGTHGPA